jgi:hypothetical protein
LLSVCIAFFADAVEFQHERESLIVLVSSSLGRKRKTLIKKAQIKSCASGFFDCIGLYEHVQTVFGLLSQTKQKPTKVPGWQDAKCQLARCSLGSTPRTRLNLEKFAV